MDFMESHTDSNICITNHRTHNRITGKIKECEAYINRNIDIQQAMWGGSHFCNATIMYRTVFLKLHLDLDEFIKRRLSLQDWPAYVILTAYSGIDILPVSTATLGIETVSITRPDTVEKFAKRYKGDKEVCRYLGELFPNKFPFNEQEWNRYIAGRLAAKAFDVCDFKNAKYYCSKNSTGISKLKMFCVKWKWSFYLLCNVKKAYRKVIRNEY